MSSQFRCPEGLKMMSQKWSFMNKGNVFMREYDITIDKDEYCLNIIDNQPQLYVCKNKYEDIVNHIQSAEEQKSSK